LGIGAVHLGRRSALLIVVLRRRLSA
jgi:hypothetical protein